MTEKANQIAERNVQIAMEQLKEAKKQAEAQMKAELDLYFEKIEEVVDKNKDWRSREYHITLKITATNPKTIPVVIKDIDINLQPVNFTLYKDLIVESRFVVGIGDFPRTIDAGESYSFHISGFYKRKNHMQILGALLKSGAFQINVRLTDTRGNHYKMPIYVVVTQDQDLFFLSEEEYKKYFAEPVEIVFYKPNE